MNDSRESQCVQLAFAAKREIDKGRLGELPATHVTPIVKTLEALWESCGLPGGLGLQESSSLLNDWVTILYGPDVASSVNVEARASDIARKQIEANRRYHEVEDAPHFFFALPIDSLVCELTEQLPRYDAVA